MSKHVAMIMPMAGRGSRFAKEGEILPKPLIQIAGKPFFYWATLGIVREVPGIQLVYIVLQEHVEKFAIDHKIRDYFPDAEVVAIAEVTSGALETALKASTHVDQEASIIVNDCDHAFSYSRLNSACEALSSGVDGFLSHFQSREPHFSFAEYSGDGALVRTAEKDAISNLAIAGIYGFSSFRALSLASERYALDCPYPELFISGVYNEMLKKGALVRGFSVDFHIPFGTPEEYGRALGRVAELESLEQ
ncbi:NTP transferase domain-containing protein [Xanthomonas sp. LMG 12462]|uniref:NTP transferase domain-containing protein n=1 Tax=Xanthomonas sp. LMG 12462 TaxID=1591134 RepID=UPI0012646F23|nr:NTP transferase domain-containing protein [Xanthomonas sp. LMG 12462]